MPLSVPSDESRKKNKKMGKIEFLPLRNLQSYKGKTREKESMEGKV